MRILVLVNTILKFAFKLISAGSQIQVPASPYQFGGIPGQVHGPTQQWADNSQGIPRLPHVVIGILLPHWGWASALGLLGPAAKDMAQPTSGPAH